ncbi:MAG: hypothetical protein RL701_4915 [Pseudomonadota bacterium]
MLRPHDNPDDDALRMTDPDARPDLPATRKPPLPAAGPHATISAPLGQWALWQKRFPGLFVGAALTLGCVYFVREREFSATRLDRRFGAADGPLIVVDDGPTASPPVDYAAKPSALDAAGRSGAPLQSAAKRSRGSLAERADAGVASASSERALSPAPAAAMRGQPQSQPPRKRLGEPQRTLPPRPTAAPKAATESDEDAIWGDRR